MWIFFLVLAVFGTLVLAVHLILEMNSLDKKVQSLTDEIRKHYEDNAHDPANQSPRS